MAYFKIGYVSSHSPGLTEKNYRHSEQTFSGLLSKDTTFITTELTWSAKRVSQRERSLEAR
jgi:hypothetical protein